MTTDKLIKDLNNRHRKISKYNLEIGPGILKLFKRICIVKYKYLVYVFFRIVAEDAEIKAKLFFKEYLYVPVKDPNGRHYYFFGTLGLSEFPLTKFLIKNIKDDDVFYDIGSNYGFYTLLFSKFSLKGQVHSFEPNKICVGSLRLSTTNKKNVKINQIGVYDKESVLPLYGKNSDFGKGTAANSLEFSISQHRNLSMLYKVPTISLDEYCITNTPPTIIKIDIEGGEYKALLGARKILEKHSPIIAMEVLSGDMGKKYSEPAVNLLRSMGYFSYLIQDDGSLNLCRTINYESINNNFSNFIFKK